MGGWTSAVTKIVRTPDRRIIAHARARCRQAGSGKVALLVLANYCRHCLILTARASPNNLQLTSARHLVHVVTHHAQRSMSEERRPRSRFDSDDTERPVRSRFDTDRRSRSPSRRESESHRARSPVTREASDSPAAASIKNKAAAAAAAAAARINAQIQAKKGIQHVDVPPIRSVG